MQSNKITIPVGGSVSLPADGSLVVFESGVSTTANNYIIVKGEAGSEIRLKQGQGMRAERSRTWVFTCADPTASIEAQIIVGEGEFHDSAVNATIAGAVIVTSGTVQTVAGSETKVNNTDAQAVPVRHQKLATVTNNANVVAGLAQVALSNDPTLRQLRIRNTHPTATIAIGMTGITLATAVIVLDPNAVWIEEDAAGAAWYVISDTANTNVATMGLKE